eukprot:COSAG01_NODE_3522_length_5978_cov_1.601803_2_plen_57_part_01
MLGALLHLDGEVELHLASRVGDLRLRLSQHAGAGRQRGLALQTPRDATNRLSATFFH